MNLFPHIYIYIRISAYGINSFCRPVGSESEHQCCTIGFVQHFNQHLNSTIYLKVLDALEILSQILQFVLWIYITSKILSTVSGRHEIYLNVKTIAEFAVSTEICLIGLDNSRFSCLYRKAKYKVTVKSLIVSYKSVQVHHQFQLDLLSIPSETCGLKQQYCLVWSVLKPPGKGWEKSKTVG